VILLRVKTDMFIRNFALHKWTQWSCDCNHFS